MSIVNKNLTQLHKSFEDKTVIITGHTGFKGSWLSTWLKMLGANVVGISLLPSTNPSLYLASNLKEGIVDLQIDIRDLAQLEEAIISAKPDYVFHLAAQALVNLSYTDPVMTWQTNVIGTLNVLESLRKLNNSCVAVLITSDKCYKNSEWVWGYREIDEIGGIDPYSASKGAAELVINSYVKSFFPIDSSSVRIASTRAGNVIGGGDWSDNRIVPDCIKAWSVRDVVTLRNPNSTRPWQHVLEPLGGYLTLALALNERPEFHGQAFNFGPSAQQNKSVLELVKQMSLNWDQVRWQVDSNSKIGQYESGLLKLNCDKSLHLLGWYAVLDFENTVSMTTEWYRSYYENPCKIELKTKEQIETYMQIAKNQGLSFAQ